MEVPHFVRGALVCLVTMAFLGSVPVSTSREGATDEFLAFAQRLTRTAFTDLIDDSVELSINLVTLLGRDWDADGVMRLEVRRFLSHETDQARYETLAEGMFRAVNGTFESVRFRGKFAESAAAGRLESEVMAHPDWDDKEMAVALTRAGARVAMSEPDEFIRAGGVERIVVLFGRVLAMEAQFLWRKDTGNGTRANVPPGWVVNLKVDDVREERRCYALRFDPVTLRLNSALALECRTE